MKLLLDSCVWGGAAGELRAAGHDVIWAGDWDIDPGDDEILARAHTEQRILITLDKDFGELAIFRRQPHCGIIRLVGFSGRRQAGACLIVLQRYASDLSHFALITVEQGRVRIRIPEP